MMPDLRLSPLVFSGCGLDRMDMIRGDSHAISALRDMPDSRFLVLSALKVLMRTGPVLDPVLVPRRALGNDVTGAILLGRDQSGPIFALDVDPDRAAAIGNAVQGETDFLDVRSIAMSYGSFEVDQGRAGLIGMARALVNWHARNGYCAACGSETEMVRGGLGRQCISTNCAAEHFPRVDPVVIMLIHDGARCLLGRSSYFTPKVYSALAGFMEVGESIEEAARREAKEEAGIVLGDIYYLGSQPWPFPSSLMIGLFAKAETTDIVLDKKELEDARWFSVQEVRQAMAGAEDAPFQAPTSIAIAHHLLKAWLVEMETEI